MCQSGCAMRLVARVSGFGQTGPNAPLPGFGSLVGSFAPSEINQPTASPFSAIAGAKIILSPCEIWVVK
jgi:hypothetical protein